MPQEFLYAHWTRHMNLARGFNDFDGARQFAHDNRAQIGHAWRIEQRTDQYWVIHSYMASSPLYFESIGSDFRGPYA